MADNSAERRQWDDPDPRIKWALDILDWEGAEVTSVPSYYMMPFSGASLGIVLKGAFNRGNRLPMRTGLPIYALFAAIGYQAGVYAREWNGRKNASELAVLKHYIMTNPEKFPEPENKKYGDKEVLLPWLRLR